MKKENKSTHKHTASAVSGLIKNGKRFDSSTPDLKEDIIIFWCGNCKQEYQSKK